MNSELISFYVWCSLMVAMLIAMLFSIKRTRHIDREAEDVAAVALPEIGNIATSCHQKRFGKRPDTVDDGPWYPAISKKKSLHQV